MNPLILTNALDNSTLEYNELQYVYGHNNRIQPEVITDLALIKQQYVLK